jgi:hypothetical protein
LIGGTRAHPFLNRPSAPEGHHPFLSSSGRGGTLVPVLSA